MDYILVCPTYKRIKTLKNKTLSLLTRTNAPLPELWINVDEDIALYSLEFPDYIIHQAGTDIGTKRNAIQDYYPVGSRIVFIDDDIKDIVVKEGNKKRSIIDFNKMVEFCFTNAELYKSKIWGLYPIANPLFMKNIFRQKLCYIIASCFGLINTRFSVKSNYAEDVERSLLYYKDQSLLFRVDFIGIYTNYYKEPGGLQETRTEQKNYDSKKLLAEEYSEFCKLAEKRGRAEIIYNRTKNKNIEYQETLDF